MGKEMKLSITLELDEEWAGNHDESELVEYLRHKWSTDLGFRGEVRRLSIVKR